MRRLGLLLAGLVVLVATAPAPAWAQAPAPLSITEVDLSAFPQVTATVGAPPVLAGRVLPPEAFAVAENGRPVAPTVTPVPGEQLEVILVIDTSGSMAGAAMEAAKRAAVAFLTAMPPTARIAVVGFGASPVLASGFSLDLGALAGAVNGLVARGETALYDAVTMAVAQFPEGTGTHRSIVLLSDGGDTVSKASLESAAAAVASARVRVDVVELASAESNREALVRLVAGGGQVGAAGDPGALDAIYRGIAAALTSQYRIAFASEAAGPGELRVTIVHQGVTVEGVAAFDAPVPPAEPVTPPPDGPSGAVAPEPGGGGALLVAGGAALFVALCGIGLVLFIPGRRRPKLANWGELPAKAAAAPSTIAGLVKRASKAADTALERRGKRGSLGAALERAGIALRPGEFLVLCGGGAVLALLLGLLLFGPLAGLAGGLLAAGAARMWLGMVARKRQAKFGGQLSDTLQLMGGTLRAGYGLIQALDATAREAPSPTADEFRRVVVESRLGRGLTEALHAMSERMASQDFEWVVEAIEINREVGGDLAEVLDRVSATIRERDQVRRQVKALSAEGRLSAYVLMALPVGLSVMIRARNPSYFGELLHGGGLYLSAVGVVLMIVGGVWLRKVCRLVF